MSDYELGEVVKTGYLTKSPPLSRAPVSQWHRRWFELMDSRLVYPMAKRYIRLNYYQSEADAKSLADPKGTINLNACVRVIPHINPIKNFKHVFDLCTEDRIYHLSADTSDEKWAWINTLTELLFSSTIKKDSDPSRPTNIEETGDNIITKRTRDGTKPVRPHSFNPPSSSPSGGSGKISSRPLPPVPGLNSPGSPAPVPRKLRPLPSPPMPGLSTSTPAIHIQSVGPHMSQVSSHQGKKLPPSRPAPYRKNVSEPSPPVPLENPASVPHSKSFSPPRLLPEDYQEFVARPDLVVANLLADSNMEDNYSLASSVPRRRPPSPAGPRPPPSPKPSAPQKPTKPPKPAVLAKPGHLASSKLSKPAAAASPPVTSRTYRPVPKTRTAKPAKPPVTHPVQTTVVRPGDRKVNEKSNNRVLDESQSDYSVLEEDQPDYSVVEDTQPDYSVLEDSQPDYSVLEENQPDYSVLEENQPDYSVLEENQPDYSVLEENQLDYSVVDGNDYSVLEDEEQNYSFVEDTGQNYNEVEGDAQNYSEIADTGQDYDNIDTELEYGNIDNSGQDYGNIDDSGQDYGNIDDSIQEYSVLQSTTVPGYNPRDMDYSHLDSTQGTVESPPPPIRHSSLAPHHTSGHTSSHAPSHTSSLTSPTTPQDCTNLDNIPRAKAGQARTATRQKPRPQRKPVKDGVDYSNWPSASNTDDYSRLNY